MTFSLNEEDMQTVIFAEDEGTFSLVCGDPHAEMTAHPNTCTAPW